MMFADSDSSLVFSHYWVCSQVPPLFVVDATWALMVTLPNPFTAWLCPKPLTKPLSIKAVYWPPRRRSTKCSVDSFWML